MNSKTGRPILVTGAHRTGTTWVGRMLAADAHTAYISEPLNVLHRPGVLRSPVARWYTCITPENEADYLPAFGELLNFRYHLLAEVRALRSARDALRMGRDLGTFVRGGLLHQRPLLKDPFAIFSIPWFMDRLDCQVLVTVRHPAAFASSLKRLNWRFDFNDLLGQPPLMKAYLAPYRAQMEAMPADDLIGQAALLWTMIYRAVDGMRGAAPSIQIVRHEDLSLDPIAGFGKLYAELGLDFTPAVKAKIEGSSSSDNPGELSMQQTHSVNLDSRSNLENWKRRLSPEEIERVRGLSGEIAQRYYPEAVWR
jgi:hypothetical protein